MANSTVFLAICAILTAHMIIPSFSAVDSIGDYHQLGWINPMGSTSTCRGSIAECLAGNEEFEFEMDSETNRRILATRQYISYGALSRNRVPCSRRGASYYNCRPGAQANPYTRGCSAITRCRR